MIFLKIFTVVLIVNIALCDVDSVEKSCILSASHNDISNVMSLIDLQNERIKALESLVDQLASKNFCFIFLYKKNSFYRIPRLR